MKKRTPDESDSQRAGRSSPARFCFALPAIFALLVFSVPVSRSQDEPARLIAPSLQVSPNGSVIAAQGELLLFVGDRAAFAPARFRPAADGYNYAMEHAGVVYQAHAAGFVIDPTGAAAPAARLSVTASALEDADAVVWCAWRHRPRERAAPAWLLSPEAPLLETIEAPLPWNEAWTWWFDGPAYIRHDLAVYAVERAEGWDRQQWVRLPQKPYAPLGPDSETGFIRFERELKANQTASLSLIAPFEPIAGTVMKEFVSE